MQLLALAGESSPQKWSAPRPLCCPASQSLYLRKIPHRLPMPGAVMAVQNIAHLLPGVVHRAVDLLNRQACRRGIITCRRTVLGTPSSSAESDILSRCLVGRRSTLLRSKSGQTEGTPNWGIRRGRGGRAGATNGGGGWGPGRTGNVGAPQRSRPFAVLRKVQPSSPNACRAAASCSVRHAS